MDVADGKNDGSVANVRYFTCAANFGLFVKKAQIKLDKEDTSSSSAARVKKPEVKEEVAGDGKKSGKTSPPMSLHLSSSYFLCVTLLSSSSIFLAYDLCISF